MPRLVRKTRAAPSRAAEAMDDVELPSDDESANGQSEEEFHMNSDKDNNSASLNMGKIPNLTTIWSEVVQIDFGFHGYEVKYADVPQQTENFSNDSGIFAMKNLELWDINVCLMDKFSEDDSGHLRIKYVDNMIFNEHNCSVDGRSKVMEYDAEVYEKYYKRA